MPERHADPGQQLGNPERLTQIIVGAEVKCRNLVMLLTAGGDHNDGSMPGAADLPSHLESIQIGQPEIQQHNLWIAAGGLRETFAGGASLDDLVVVGPQRATKKAPHLGLVFDHQNQRSSAAHELPPGSLAGSSGNGGPTSGRVNRNPAPGESART